MSFRSRDSSDLSKRENFVVNQVYDEHCKEISFSRVSVLSFNTESTRLPAIVSPPDFLQSCSRNVLLNCSRGIFLPAIREKTVNIATCTVNADVPSTLQCQCAHFQSNLT